MRWPGIEDCPTHESAPQKSRPVIGTRRECVLIDQAIFARRERVVENDFNATLGHTTVLVEVAENVEKRGCPGIAAACRIGCLGHPHRLARFETVAENLIKGSYLIRASEPLFRQRCTSGRAGYPTAERCAALGSRRIGMVGEDVE